MLNMVTVRGWKSKEEVMLQSTLIKEEVMLQSTPIKVIKKHIHDVFYSFSIGQNLLCRTNDEKRL